MALKKIHLQTSDVFGESACATQAGWKKKNKMKLNTRPLDQFINLPAIIQCERCRKIADEKRVNQSYFDSKKFANYSSNKTCDIYIELHS